MGEHSEVYVAFDTAKLKHAVAIAEGVRGGEIRFVGEIENRPATIERLIKKLARRYKKLQVCFEAGPTGYGLYRQMQALGHGCLVVAPALIPRRSGERVKTNRRDALTLARLFRAGELSGVWVPDEVHEAVRDLVRGRMTAAEDVRRKRQQLLSFLLRHGRIFTGGDRPDPGRQPASPSGPGRGGLELPPSGSRQRDPASSPRSATKDRPRHRLEGTSPIVRPLSTAQRCRQETTRHHRRDRPRDGCIPVGDRPPDHASYGHLSGLHTLLRSVGDGATEGNSRR